MEFNYKYITLEEIDMYQYYYFVCDGDNKKIKPILRSDENENNM